MKAETATSLIRLFARRVAQKPCRVLLTPSRPRPSITITPHPNDMATFIGRGGETIKALKALVTLSHCGADLLLAEPPNRGDKPPTRPLNPGWNPADEREFVAGWAAVYGLGVTISPKSAENTATLALEGNAPPGYIEAIHRTAAVYARANGGVLVPAEALV